LGAGRRQAAGGGRAARPHAQGELQLEVVVHVDAADGLGGHHLQALDPRQAVLAHGLEGRREALDVVDGGGLLLRDRRGWDGARGERLLRVARERRAVVVHVNVRRRRRRRRLGALALDAHRRGEERGGGG
jgi:hypothetical protein